MAEFSNQVSAYCEVVLLTIDGRKFVLWGDEEESTDPNTISMLSFLIPTSVEVTCGLGCVSEVRFSGTVPWPYRKEVMQDGAILNELGNLRVRFHDPVCGIVSPWYGGITKAPEISIGATGIDFTLNARGVTGAMCEFGLKRQVKAGDTVFKVLSTIFSELGIEAGRWTFPNDRKSQVVVGDGYAFSRASLMEDLSLFLEQYQLCIFEDTSCEGEGDAALKSRLCIVPLAGRDPTRVTLLRYMVGGETGLDSEGRLILPILDMSLGDNSSILWAPGYGNVQVKGIDRATGQPIIMQRTAAKDAGIDLAGGSTPASATLKLPGMVASLATLQKNGYFGNVVPDTQREDAKVGKTGQSSAEPLAAVATYRSLYAVGFDAEVSTLGHISMPGDYFVIDDVIPKVDGLYWSKSVVQSFGNGSWGTKLNGVRFGDSTMVDIFEKMKYGDIDSMVASAGASGGSKSSTKQTA